MLTSGFKQKTLIDIHHAALVGALFSSKIGLFTQKIRVKVYFFLKIVWKLRKNAYLCSEIYAINAYFQTCPCVGGYLKTSMERDLRPVVRPVSKGRFRTLLSVKSNLANLNLLAAVMQQKAFTWVDFISPCGQHSLYIYNKVYPVQ